MIEGIKEQRYHLPARLKRVLG